MPAMTLEEARRVERKRVRVGESRTFYCEVQEEYVPPEKRLRRHTGTTVRVLLRIPADDPDSSPLYRVQAEDGTKFEAHEEELSGWDLDLGQYFWPDGTYGPDHDRQFLANERRSA